MIEKTSYQRHLGLELMRKPVLSLNLAQDLENLAVSDDHKALSSLLKAQSFEPKLLDSSFCPG